MDLSDVVARDIVSWYRSELTDPDFYCNFPNSDWMLYGVTDAQKLYLMVDYVLADLMIKQVDPYDLTEDMLKALVETARKGVDKTEYKEVSNYWLKRIGSLAYDAQKLHTRMLLKDKAQQTNADVRKIGKLTTKLKAIVAENETSDRGQFVNRFLKSARFSLVRDWDKAAELTKLVSTNSASLKAPEHTESGNARSLDSVLQDLTIRRMCKFLIYDSIGQGKGVAYLLDDIDLDRVAFMLAPDGTLPDIARVGAEKKVPVCTSEIREIFRNWDRLSDHVIFYRQFKRCAPPWEAPTGSSANLRNWAAYAAHRATKILSDAKVSGGLGPTKDALERVVKAYTEKRDSHAIRDFHACRPSVLDRQRFMHTTIANREVKNYA